MLTRKGYTSESAISLRLDRPRSDAGYTLLELKWEFLRS
jgi:hypothetical protein